MADTRNWRLSQYQGGEETARMPQWIVPIPDDAVEAGLSWYIDASQGDAKFAESTRFGYGMLAVNEYGKLIAAAVGTPPQYVRTIAQAEAHALAMVLSHTSCCKEIVTNCQSNLTVLDGGFKAATNGRKRAPGLGGSLKLRLMATTNKSR